MKTRRKNGFTLVEMIVAAGVFVIMATMLSQVVFMTSQGITNNTKLLDSASQARIFFDRLAHDLAARPLRSDVGGVAFTKVDSNKSDTLQFYSRVGGFYAGTPPAPRQMSLVGYRVIASPTTGGLCLERGASNLDWSAGNSLVFVLPGAAQPGVPASGGAAPAVAEGDFDVLADGIFRMEFCFLHSDGTLSNTAKADYSDVAGLVVGVAVLDSRSMRLLNSTQLTSLADDFDDCAEGFDPLSQWNTQMSAATFLNGFPKQAAAGVRVFQRTFYVQ